MNFINELKIIYTKLSEKENLKKLLFFLLLNLSVMFVEVLYGVISNSLGLLTDGAHMLLDCSAIIIGLYSSYLSDKNKNKHFNFGYSRSEVLGTFINAVFLYFIALYIVFESLERFVNPKEIHSNHLILVSFLGLVINLIGVYYLHGSHSHEGHNHSHSHEHSHEEGKKQKHKIKEKHEHKHKEKTHKKNGHDIEAAHASSEESHGHSHSCGHEEAGKLFSFNNLIEYNENLYAIYIHILADALGSVSVLISSFLIRYYNLNFTDPLCSLFIAGMILYSAWPVLKKSSLTLLHYLPENLMKKKKKIEKAV